MNGLFSTLQKSRQQVVNGWLLHVLLLVILFVIIIVVRLFFGLLGLFFRLLFVIFLLLACFLHLVHCLPLLSEAVCLSNIISDDDVVEDGLRLHLPQIETNESEVGVLVDSIIIHKLGIIDFLGLPHTFVLWVGDSLCLPITLVLWIVLHRCLPFTIFLIIPVIRFLCLCINNALFRHPVLWFGILRIIHHRCVDPIPPC